MEPSLSLLTTAVHAGEPDPKTYGCSTTPIFQSSVYEFRGTTDEKLRYPRYGNTPNHDVLAKKLAALEGGEDAIVAATGMAAITGAILASLGRGGHLLLQQGAYGGLSSFVLQWFDTLGFEYDLIDGTRPETWAAKSKPNTRAIYVESMSNPCCDVPDLEAVVAFAKSRDLVSLVDNTFASPVIYRAAASGFDLSLHSATKYLNGHDDLVAGCAIGRADLVAKVRAQLKLFGGALDPHACWLLHRGIRTVGLRVPHQSASALAIARFLEGHARVESVRYPGLESSPHHARATRAFRNGFGGVVAFELKGGEDEARRLQDRVRIPIVAPSLGGVETLMSMPAFVSHRDVPKEQRLQVGISDGLIRLSVGIESKDDLIADLEHALGGG